VIAGRYRIVGLLGRGGMGEVYRADDLKLGQPVALKFLPPGFDADPGRLERLLDEVRIARQVSHAGVCRIYDVAEAEGQQFLSMEYVDGEDLASLLRRIGRLPKDKAIQIARQLCAGLAASHDAGVLHRDLKPANVMIDGRGRARITDFGLAALERELGPADIVSGTPGYMAPEQLAGREVTVRSDIYALGLVLYELFTGRPAFTASSVNELKRLQSETTPSSPSSLVEGFDPVVERVILRCLDPDPARRPPSALAVAAALPGGDPLAAALAAGETPSPQMVAEVDDREAQSPALAWGALAVFAVFLGVFVALSPWGTLLEIVPLEKPPEALREHAREILRLAAVTERPADSVFAFEPNRPWLHAAVSREELLKTPPCAVTFQYRHSPVPLTPLSAPALRGEVDDPPSTTPGMARVDLDPEGRLLSLAVVPGEDAPESAAAGPDWDPLLRATGVDAATLQPAAPEWAPSSFADQRVAWTGTWSGRPDVPLRIEAASLQGRPVSLRVITPWMRPSGEPKPAGSESVLSRAALIANALAYVLALVAAALVALRNVRNGRGDRRGALRFALYLGAVRMLWYPGAHHVMSTGEVEIFVGHLSYALQRVGIAYVFYLAVEPYARRLWPRVLVSWVRVLDGRFRDPLVGRDLLLGAAAGAAMSCVERAGHFAGQALGETTQLPPTWDWTLYSLGGPLATFVSVLGIHTGALLDVIIPLMLLLVFRLALRRTVPAAAVVSLIGMLIFSQEFPGIAITLIVIPVWIALFWIVLYRFGLLGLAAMFTVSSLISELPLTLHPETWYLGSMLLALAAIVAPALWGFWTSQAGRPLLRDGVLESH